MNYSELYNPLNYSRFAGVSPRSPKRDLEVEYEALLKAGEEIDWDIFSYEKRHRCPSCKGKLLLIRKMCGEQRFRCKNCREEFALYKDYRKKGENKFLWRRDLSKITK